LPEFADNSQMAGILGGTSPNLIVSVPPGGVELYRENWPGYLPVGFGTAVRRGDLIRPADGETVHILCADLEKIKINKEEGIPCKVEEPPLQYSGARVETPRAPGAGVPYVLYPRATHILDTRPTLRWRDTGGPYTVSVVDLNGNRLWSKDGVTDNELPYPGTDNLLPGDYQLIVTDERTNTSSDDDPNKGLGFTLVSSEEQATLTAKCEEILKLEIDPPARQFALAIYYAGQGLYGDALSLLDKVLKTDPGDAPAVHLWRGFLLLEVKLPSEAEDALRTAYAEATELGDVETRAAAEAGLWWATSERSYLNKAIALYKELGATDMIEVLRSNP
jgi:hypothetical protein